MMHSNPLIPIVTIMEMSDDELANHKSWLQRTIATLPASSPSKLLDNLLLCLDDVCQEQESRELVRKGLI